MPSLIPTGKQQYFDNAGVPLAGGKIYTYAAGTTNPKVTYSDAAGAVPNTNPIVLNSRGEAQIFWSGAYKVVLQDALGNVIWTVDNIIESNLGSRTSTTGSAVVPVGTTAQRDTPAVTGYFRFNVDLGCYEGNTGGVWRSLPWSVNGTPVVDGGDIKLKTVAGASIVGAGEALVSGTHIKTVNGQSLLGAGDVPSGSPFFDTTIQAQVNALALALLITP